MREVARQVGAPLPLPETPASIKLSPATIRADRRLLARRRDRERLAHHGRGRQRAAGKPGPTSLKKL